jgi:ubiquinone/menaquinone biosynthesis C-methylase UbiE
VSVPASSRVFDRGAAGYEQTIARTLLPVAHHVVELAMLQPGERVLDIGTGTGTAAAAALGEGRSVVGIDGAPGMLELARQRVHGASFAQMDFNELTFPAGSFDVILASHALLFAADRVAALAEWRRVTRPHGRLSLSVPGPDEVTPAALYHEVFARHAVGLADPYPTRQRLIDEAVAAGWMQPEVEEDPSVTIRLADEAAFRTWRSIGPRGNLTVDWSPEQHEALTRDMLAVSPRERDGSYVIPFGAIYLTARNGA